MTHVSYDPGHITCTHTHLFPAIQQVSKQMSIEVQYYGLMAVCVRACARARACVCVCVRACVCARVCACVCVLSVTYICML